MTLLAALALALATSPLAALALSRPRPRALSELSLAHHYQSVSIKISVNACKWQTSERNIEGFNLKSRGVTSHVGKNGKISFKNVNKI